MTPMVRILRRARQSPLESALLVILLVIDGVISWQQWWMTARGFDLTDEGMYVSWLNSPSDWPWSSTQFAFVFSPLWQLAGGDLVTLRRVTVALLLCAGALFCWAVFRYGLEYRQPGALLWGVAAAPIAVIGVGSPAVFATPNYNILGLIGLLTSGTAIVAILLADRSLRWPWLLLGIGGVLFFLSRPTAGALLLVIVLGMLLIARSWSWRGLGLASAAAALGLLCCALAIDGSHFWRFPNRVLEGIELYKIQTRRSALDALVNTWAHKAAWESTDQLSAIILALPLAIIALGFAFNTTRPAARLVATVLGGLSVLAAIWLAIIGWTPLTEKHTRMVTVTMALAALPTLALCWRSGLRPARARLSVALAIALLPLAYAFGTYNSTVSLAGTAAICWFGAQLLLTHNVPGKQWVFVLLSLWLATVTLSLTASAQAPARQEALNQQIYPVRFGGGGELLLSADMKRYLDEFSAQSKAAGFVPGDPILDLTGESPGLIRHLQASATADPWVIGGYVGSEDRLSRQLTKHTDCRKIGYSWLLTTPDGARKVNPTVLEKVGLTFPDDYQLVAQLTAPAASKGYQTQLWRPLDPQQGITTCQASR